MTKAYNEKAKRYKLQLMVWPILLVLMLKYNHPNILRFDRFTLTI